MPIFLYFSLSQPLATSTPFSSSTHVQVKKEDLQLIGATTCLIACKVRLNLLFLILFILFLRLILTILLFLLILHLAGGREDPAHGG